MDTIVFPQDTKYDDLISFMIYELEIKTLGLTISRNGVGTYKLSSLCIETLHDRYKYDILEKSFVAEILEEWKDRNNIKFEGKLMC